MPIASCSGFKNLPCWKPRTHHPIRNPLKYNRPPVADTYWGILLPQARLKESPWKFNWWLKLAQGLRSCNGKAFRSSARIARLHTLPWPKSWLRFTSGQRWSATVVLLIRFLRPYPSLFFKHPDRIFLLSPSPCCATPDWLHPKSQAVGTLTWVTDGKESIGLPFAFAWAALSIRLSRRFSRLWLTLEPFTPKHHLLKFCWNDEDFFFTFIWAWRPINGYTRLD